MTILDSFKKVEESVQKLQQAIDEFKAEFPYPLKDGYKEVEPHVFIK